MSRMAGGKWWRLGVGSLLWLSAWVAGAQQVGEAETEPPAVPVPALDLKRSEPLLSTERLVAAGHHIRDSAAVIGGKASYYSRRFEGRLAATGEVFRSELLTAASNIFPLGSWLAVRRGDSKCVVVRVNDRMHPKNSRILDLSYAAARQLNMIANGVAAVEARLLPFGFDPQRHDCAQAFAGGAAE